VRKNELAVIKTLMRRLNTDVTAVEERYQDLLRRRGTQAFPFSRWLALDAAAL